eukprot:TRINITY_DN8831_c0_g1_i1.p1 TRINITY_DN8831_c0_g1~~TRINITY_DN8831_c0_g1_i1.p1  ORF type:complete len:301 (-),score=67.35 TRINITY_DN8831_c0_g1_i1:105-920(-)
MYASRPSRRARLVYTKDQMLDIRIAQRLTTYPIDLPTLLIRQPNQPISTEHFMKDSGWVPAAPTFINLPAAMSAAVSEEAAREMQLVPRRAADLLRRQLEREAKELERERDELEQDRLAELERQVAAERRLRHDRRGRELTARDLGILYGERSDDSDARYGSTLSDEFDELRVRDRWQARPTYELDFGLDRRSPAYDSGYGAYGYTGEEGRRYRDSERLPAADYSLHSRYDDDYQRDIDELKLRQSLVKNDLEQIRERLYRKEQARGVKRT